MPQAMPTVFISHGTPDLLLHQGPDTRFFQELAEMLPRPQAIVCVSAHWEATKPTITANPRPETIHDFYGFPQELYQLRYSAPGAPELAQLVGKMLGESGLDAAFNQKRGLDHGVWVPLQLMYPSADIPVIQLAVQTSREPDHHLAVGRALKPLRHQGVLILGSGGATHNLREFGMFAEDAPPVAYARDFDNWLNDAIAAAQEEELCDYKIRAPEAERNHPTSEHILPLFVPLGAAGKGEQGKQLHKGIRYGMLSMAAYAWGV